MGFFQARVLEWVFLLQGIFLNQGLNPRLSHLLCWEVGSSPLGHLGRPYNGVSLSHKRKEIVPSAETCMDLEPIIESEVSQKERHRYHRISLKCGI